MGHLGIWAECKISKLRFISVMDSFKSPLPQHRIDSCVSFAKIGI